MPDRLLPGLSLRAFWDLGANGWKPGMDTDILTVSVLLAARIISSVAAEPGVPTDGDIHFLTGTANAGKLAVRDAGAWVYIAPPLGWRTYDTTTGKHYRFLGGTVLTEDGNVVGREIFVSTGVPSVGDGKDGDIWFQVT